MALVKDIMTAPVITLDENVTLRDATIIMAHRKVSGSPVVDQEGKLTGILSESDILEEAMNRVGDEMACRSLSFLPLPYERFIKNEEICRQFSEVGDVKVNSVMNDEIVVIDGDDDVEDALITMLRFDVNRLPVVDKEGRLIGILARQDVLWSMCRSLQSRPKRISKLAK
ncbi:MAG: CBS domain-containing protein [Euryarchaeota archaeon]|nr:CBS domain-containing protein [Euryarchaeota archaeon]